MLSNLVFQGLNEVPIILNVGLNRLYYNATNIM